MLTCDNYLLLGKFVQTPMWFKSSHLPLVGGFIWNFARSMDLGSVVDGWLGLVAAATLVRVQSLQLIATTVKRARFCLVLALVLIYVYRGLGIF